MDRFQIWDWVWFSIKCSYHPSDRWERSDGKLGKRIPEKDPDTGDILYTHEVQLELYSSHDALRDIARTLGLFKDYIHATLEGQIGVLKVGSDMDMDTWAE